MKTAALHLTAILAALPALAGCVETWRADPVAAVGQLDVPECAAVDPQTGLVYVSNMASEPGRYWTDDGFGAISLFAPGGTPLDLGWRMPTEDQPIHSPKGMVVFQGVLYVADNTRVLGFPLSEEAAGQKPLPSPKGRRLNDMATDGEAVYVSDTEAGLVYRMAPDGVTTVKAPPGVNGITFYKGTMFAVSWDLHEVYRLDPTGRADPEPLGLACHFKTPDGIEVLEDGTLLVSDMHGGRVVAVTPERHVYTLLELETPADIGLDRDRLLLYVPQFEADRLTVWRLKPVKKK